MKFIVLCLCLSSTVSAAPTLYNYMPFSGARRPFPPAQMKSGYGGPQTGPAAISMEIVYPQIYPPLFPGGAAGGSVPGSTNPSQAFIKYSLPKAPGRKSVEIYYPFDFSQQRMIPNFPQLPNIPSYATFDHPAFPPMTGPQQPVNSPTFETSPPQLQNPFQAPQQDQPPPPTQEETPPEATNQVVGNQ
ncbi:unnamed protein product [Gadus morhua 'NCC']